MRKYLAKVSAASTAVAVFLIAAAPAHAAGTYDSITGAVNWSDVTTALTAVAALIAAVLVVRRGIRLILGMISR